MCHNLNTVAVRARGRMERPGKHDRRGARGTNDEFAPPSTTIECTC